MIADYLQALRLFQRDVRLFLFASAFVGFTYFGIYTLLLNLYLLRLGYGPAQVGLINGAGPLAMAIGGLPIGALSQRWGSRRAFIVGFCLFIIGYGLLPWVEFIPAAGRISWLIATYMLVWVGGAFYVICANPFLINVTSSQERNYAFALQSAILALSGFVGNLIGGLLPGWFAGTFGGSLEQALPYRYSLWLAALLALPALFAALALRPVSDEPAQTSEDANESAPIIVVVLLTLVILLRVAGEWVMRIFFNVYLDAGLHVSTARIGSLTAVGQLLGIAALSTPFVMKRWGKEQTIGWGTVGMAVAYLPLIGVSHWAGAGLGFMGMLALASLIGPAFFVFSMESVPARWRNLLSGIMFMAMGGAVALMAFGGGYLIEVLGYQMLFLVGAGLTLAGALLFFACFRQKRQETASPLLRA